MNLKTKIPKDWEEIELNGNIEVIGGFAFKSKDFKKKTKGTVPLIKIRELQNGTVKFTEKTSYLPQEFFDKFKDFQVKEGDILIALSGATTGKISVVNRNIGKALLNQRVGKFKVINKKKVSQEFFYYISQSKSFRDFVNRYIGQSAQGNLSPTDLSKVKILIPKSLQEQKAIAKILSTVDKAIQKVDEIIAKTERLKKGLMQELLTGKVRSKVEDGEVRFYKETNFKDTEIGKVPEEWEVVGLGSVAKIRGSRKLSNEFDKVAFITMELIPESGIFTRYEIRDVKDVKSYTYCEAGDLLLSKITPCFENGKQGIVPSDIPNGFALATTEVFPIVCQEIDRLFLFYILKYNKFRKVLEFSMRGATGRQRVPKDAVENLKISLPLLKEQRKIAEILSTVDKKLELERKRKEKLERIKKGLMNDLLTGKKRVNVKKVLEVG